MTTSAAERYARAQELFDAGLDLPPGERAALLDARCNGDDTLRREVEALLEADAQTDTLDEQPFTIPADLLEELADEQFAGRHFGPYEVVSELGRGGLGAVYLAVRSDGEYRKEVALKLIRRGLDTDDILRRFRNERQILAQLDHPNIARLIDGGTTDDGLPYFVMEYVRGEPITDYCERGKLSTDERLNLFRKVCGAVTYAHQNLVIHRDLKPSNILVTADGEPKLLDFGIAKLLTADSDVLTLTAPEARALTPDYASPEQINGERITTATDVYSLGVLLYELLTGTKPYRLKTHTADEMSRAIREQEPERPSTAVARADKSRTANRGPGILSGDLDTIVLAAMRKEPQRRYPSVAALAEDIRRYQHHRPVVARQDSVRYRTRKFVQRNKVAVAAAALVVASLLGALAIALTQAQRATAQARAAREQRDAAQRATERAERTSRFMQSLLNYANPHWYDRGNARTDITVREAIEDLVARMGTELADSPEVRGDLHYTVGEVHRTHGDHAVALEHFRQSLELYRQVHGNDHPKVARGMFYVSLFADDIAHAEPLLRDGIVIMRAADAGNVNLPYMLEYLAFWLMSAEGESRTAERLREAEALLEEARLLFIPHYGEIHTTIATLDHALVLLARLRGDPARAEEIRLRNVKRFAELEQTRQESLARFRETDAGGYYHIWALFYLAEAKLALGKTDEAEPLVLEAVERARATWSAGDPRSADLRRYIERARAATRP